MSAKPLPDPESAVKQFAKEEAAGSVFDINALRVALEAAADALFDAGLIDAWGNARAALATCNNFLHVETPKAPSGNGNEGEGL